MKKRGALALLFFTLAAQAGGTVAPKINVEREVEKVLKPFRDPKGISVPVKKTSRNVLLMKDKVSEGVMHYWKGKLRLEIQSPESTLLVLDGRHIWLASQQPKELGGKMEVSKTSAGNFKRSNTLIAALLENRKLLKDFKLVERVEKEGEVRMKFAAKRPDKMEIQRFELDFNLSAGRLHTVTYWDDRENEVIFELGLPKAVEGDRKQLFSYKPPKGAAVTEF